MNLIKLSDRVWISEFEEERDRPALGYIKGDNWSLAIDAGHSKEHLDEFYAELKKRDLPLPSLTVITHWHWDHSFAMHAIHGLSLANRKTNAHLRDFIENRNEESDKKFLSLDPSIALEYRNQKITVVLADIVYEGHVELDAGNCRALVYEAVSPHTDDATLILLPEERMLFFGDATSGTFPTWIANPEIKKQLITVLENTDADLFIGAHWPVWTKEDLLQHMRESLVDDEKYYSFENR